MTRQEYADKIQEIKLRVYSVTTGNVTKFVTPQHLATGEANPMWLAARDGRITGSTIAAVMGLNPYETPDDLITSKLWRTFTGNEATAYGNKSGPMSRDTGIDARNI